MNIISHKQGLLLLFSEEQLFSLKRDISWHPPIFLCCSKADISKDKNGDIADNRRNKRNKKLDIIFIFYILQFNYDSNHKHTSIHIFKKTFKTALPSQFLSVLLTVMSFRKLNFDILALTLIFL